jgi:AraC-like DNA-binding protein
MDRAPIPDWPCALDPEPRMVMWQAPPDLAPFISGYQLYVVDDNGGEPNRGAFEPAWSSIRVAVVGGALWRVRPASGEWFAPPQVSLFGPSSELVWSESGPGVLVGAGIRPRGWRRLFRQSARHWADTIDTPPFASEQATPLLRECFSAIAEYDDVRSAFDTLLRAIMLPVRGDDAAIARIEAALIDPAIASAAELADATGLPSRQLQRLTDRAFGFSPKVLLRRARFLRSLHAMRGVARSERAQMIDASYTDYSHFVRDSQDFLGMSPQAFLERDMPLLRRSLDLRTRVLGTPAQALDPVVE